MMFTKAVSLAVAFASLSSALPSRRQNGSGNDTASAGSSFTTSASPTATSPASGSSTSGSASTSGSGPGGVTINNNLDTNVYLWSVSDTTAPMLTLAPKSGTYSEKWRTSPNGGGVSIKLSTTPDQSDLLQYEYTVEGPTIYWDLSEVNMNDSSELMKYGFTVTNNGGSDCPTATCGANDHACKDAYLFPTDDHNTHGCPIATDFTLTLGM